MAELKNLILALGTACVTTLAMCTVRTSVLKDIDGGISAITRGLLESMFLGNRSTSTVGVSLPTPGSDSWSLLRLSFGALVGDEDAFTDMWFIKGASGVVPCGVTCSCVRRPLRSDAEMGVPDLVALDPTLSDITQTDQKRMGLRSDDDVWKLADYLAATAPGERKDLEVSSGIKFCSAALLYDIALRDFVQPSHNRFDPMHVVFSNGILTLELMLFLRSMKTTRGWYFEEVRRCAALEHVLQTLALTCGVNRLRAHAACMPCGGGVHRWHVRCPPPQLTLQALPGLREHMCR